MVRSQHGILVALAFGLVLAFVVDAAGAASATSPVTLAVDAAPVVTSERVLLGMEVASSMGASLSYQLGVAEAGSCAFAVLEAGERPTLMAAAASVTWQSAPSPPGATTSHYSSSTRQATLPECTMAGLARVKTDSNAAWGLQLGHVLEAHLEAGTRVRLEAPLELAALGLQFDAGSLESGRFFVRFWQPGASEAVIVAAGDIYDPPAETTGVDAASFAVQNATAILAGLGAAGNATNGQKGRLKVWDGPPPWPLLWIFTRLQRSRLLDHRARRLVHDLVEANPGIRFMELRSRSGLTTGVLTHHLGILEAHGIVASMRRGRQRHLYANGARRLASGLRVPARQEELLRALERGSCTQPELATALGVTQQAVSYHLRRLAESGLITKERTQDGCWRYSRIQDAG